MLALLEVAHSRLILNIIREDHKLSTSGINMSMLAMAMVTNFQYNSFKMRTSMWKTAFWSSIVQAKSCRSVPLLRFGNRAIAFSLQYRMSSCNSGFFGGFMCLDFQLFSSCLFYLANWSRVCQMLDEKALDLKLCSCSDRDFDTRWYSSYRVFSSNVAQKC